MDRRGSNYITNYMYPDLNNFRRAVVPWLERNEHSLFDRDIMFTKEAQEVSYVGVIDRPIGDVINELRQMNNTYATNLAALKYVINSDDVKVYERASYSYRPDGFRGKYQYHFRLWPHQSGTAIWAHYELNPWYAPRRHYAGHDWDPVEGAELAHKLFDIDVKGKRRNIVQSS